jgi:enoyl-CoA hydratase/carnithine racemase
MAERADLSNDDLSVAVSEDDLVVHATIDRPAERNALSGDVIGGLMDALEFADACDARVFVIRGAEGTFCSGGDLTTMGEDGDADSVASREQFSGLADLVETMTDAGVLTVAAVEGYCLAGGLGLATACEFVFALEAATFGTPEVNVGLFPAQAMATIMRAADEKAGLKLMFTGEFVGAEEAADIGLVTEVAAAEAFEDDLQALIDDLANNSPALIELGKTAYYTQRDLDFGNALEYLREVITIVAMSDATAEGIAAYLNDTDPDWQHR